MDNLLSIVGISGIGITSLYSIYKILNSQCVKAKCVADSDGGAHLELRLNLTDKQKELVLAHPEIKDTLALLEKLLQEKNNQLPQVQNIVAVPITPS